TDEDLEGPRRLLCGLRCGGGSGLIPGRLGVVTSSWAGCGGSSLTLVTSRGLQLMVAGLGLAWTATAQAPTSAPPPTPTPETTAAAPPSPTPNEVLSRHLHLLTPQEPMERLAPFLRDNVGQAPSAVVLLQSPQQ